MTFKKTTRAGLLALALGVLFALFLSMSAIDRTYAEEAAAPAAAADAAPPACAGNADPKLAVLEKCTPNAGDTAWMMTSVALVLLMTIPGLGLFYGGMVRTTGVPGQAAWRSARRVAPSTEATALACPPASRATASSWWGLWASTTRSAR